MQTPLDQIRVVCARPMYGGNMGSICRAMMNMGLSNLTLVNPAESLDETEIRKMSLKAFPIYKNRTQADSVREAVADCVAVAATSAREGFYRDHARTLRGWAPELIEATSAGPVALLFGSEDKGLTNDELKRATHIIRIPSTPEYSSINLAQAVLLCAYELYTAADEFEPREESSARAPIEFRERMFDAWQDAMLDISFCKEDKLEHMMMGLRRILTRGELTENDVKILMGMARQSSWASKNTRRDLEQ